MVSLQERDLLILYHTVTLYLETRLPVSSLAVSRLVSVSSATVRGMMAELEERGFLSSPHRSSGRIPTPKTLRFYVQRIMDQHCLPKEERALKEQAISGELFGQISQTLADLCQCAGVFFSIPQDPTIQAFDFLFLPPSQAISVLVTQCGHREQHLITLPDGVGHEQLQEATNYLNDQMRGLTLQQAIQKIEQTLQNQTLRLYQLSLHLVRREGSKESLDIRGHANLLHGVEALSTCKALFSWLETQQIFSLLLREVIEKRSLQIFFGLEEDLFNIHGCSLVVAPYETKKAHGFLGVVGPLHMDYRRVIPIIDTVAKLVEGAVL